MWKVLTLALLMVAMALGAAPQQSGESDDKGGRIVGGQEISITKHPHQISLRRKASIVSAFSHSCGGSIYTEDIVITAAHCVFGRFAENFTVVAGTGTRNGADGVQVRVDRIVMHENYNSSHYYNDVALLFLSSPLPIDNVTIAAINLASEVPKDGEKAIITGWGTTSSGGVSSNLLLEVEVPIVDNARCDASYAVTYGPGRITDDMVCAGLEGIGGKDACQGDSGGPLLVNRRLAGIVSWGRSCALPDYPGVYSNVAYLRQWIEDTANGIPPAAIEEYAFL